MVSYCCSNLQFLMTYHVKHLFICLFDICRCFGVSFYSGLLSIFNWVLVSLFLSCKNSLYVLITSSLSHTCFANILFHRAEVNVLINSNLLIFFLYWMNFLIMLRCQDSPNWLTVLQNSYQNPSWLFIEIDKLILNSSSTPEDLE